MLINLKIIFEISIYFKNRDDVIKFSGNNLYLNYGII